MTDVLSFDAMAMEDQRIADLVARESPRLLGFIRSRVPNPADADDLLQEVLYELVLATRLLKPIDLASAWLYRVARNRITDLFRKKRPENFTDLDSIAGDGEFAHFEDLLPSAEAGPEEALLRARLLAEMERAIAELPAEQRFVFVAHAIEGRSFKEIATDTGINQNTLLARKHYAVAYLRKRLEATHNDFISNKRDPK